MPAHRITCDELHVESLGLSVVDLFMVRDGGLYTGQIPVADDIYREPASGTRRQRRLQRQADMWLAGEVDF